MDILRNNNLFDTVFSIADVSIVLRTIYPIQITEGFQPFLSGKEENGVVVNFCEADQMDFANEEPLISELTFSVYEDRNGYYRVFHEAAIPQNNRTYATGRFCSDYLEQIYYLKNSVDLLKDSQRAFAHIAFEELLFRQGAMILHASFVNTEYGGILFTGPSGVGKSTQADLWVKYRDAELINGDRTILRNKDGLWKAYGSPYAGSSRCYVNKSCRIRAVVVLKQAENCHIQRMDPAPAFIRLYSEMVVNIWNPEYVDGITDMIRDFVTKIPVYLFAATPEKEAVGLLSNALEKEADYEG